MPFLTEPRPFLASPEQPEATKYIADRIRDLCDAVADAVTVALGEPWPATGGEADRDDSGRRRFARAWTSWTERTVRWGWIYPALDLHGEDHVVLRMPDVIIAGERVTAPWETGSRAASS